MVVIIEISPGTDERGIIYSMFDLWWYVIHVAWQQRRPWSTTLWIYIPLSIEFQPENCKPS